MSKISVDEYSKLHNIKPSSVYAYIKQKKLKTAIKKGKLWQIDQYETIQKKQRKETLCWSCKLSTGYCSWSSQLKPVNGWIAEKTIVERPTTHSKTNIIRSYKVISCPLYIKDKKKG